MSNNKNNSSDLDALFSYASLKNRLQRQIVNIGISEVKNHFGVDMRFTEYEDLVIVTEILKKFDKRYKYHITTVEGEHDIYNTEFIMPIRKDTFVYLNAVPGTSDTAVCNLYIFGKKCIAFRNYISNKLETKRDSDRLIYKVTGPTEGDKKAIKVFASKFKGRDFSTLYFNDGVAEEIKDYLDSWLKTEETYKSRGLNYHTGILLGGKPGTGKSSLASAIANYLNCDLISVDTTTFGNIALQNLVDSINHNDKKYVVLLDEIDTIFKSRGNEESTDEQRNRTTKLLKFLDSPESPNNTVFVATTNYVENILNPEINADAAAIRKGRFNKIMFIDNFNRDTAKRMCKGFNLTDKETENLLGDGDEFNPAELQSDILDIIAHKETVENYINENQMSKEGLDGC